MYWIAGIVVMSCLLLLCLARGEEVPGEISAVLKPFYKIGSYLYEKAAALTPEIFSPAQVEKDLYWLHPGEKKEELKRKYYVKKIAIFLAVILFGTLFGAAAKFNALETVILKEGEGIARRGYAEEAQEIHLAADYGEKKMDFRVEVEPVMLSGEELYRVFDLFVEKLPENILGRNESLQNVTSDLKLEKKYDGFPITAEWESSALDLLSSSGRVGEVEREERVMLSLRMRYGEYSREEEITVILKPPVLTAEEMLYREMEEMLRQSQANSRDQENWMPPSEWRGEAIGWTQVVEDNSLLLWGAAVATAFAVFFFMDKDLHGQTEKRRQSIRSQYPEIAYKLALFVGAGMTIRGAFQKIAGDYNEKHAKGGVTVPAYEEMLYTCHELQSGMSEGACYEHFGRRTGLQEYIRLCTLLAQNLKKGNSTLLERLREESDRAAEERLQQGRKLGEEAGTKLLVPMVLMLAVVMAVIMVPAFASM